MLKASPRITTGLALALTCAAGLAAQPKSDPIKIPFETYTLPNGLTTIFSVDRSTPTVAVSVWYHVGSKNEVAGRTGFAHLFEHVMFTGSGHDAYGIHDKLTNGVGGSNNGTTDNDRTQYYETVPSTDENLTWALGLEADRMVNVKFTKQILDTWGTDGWELVQVVPGPNAQNLVAYLKRPVAE